jgi:hypothetical protein
VAAHCFGPALYRLLYFYFYILFHTCTCIYYTVQPCNALGRYWELYTNTVITKCINSYIRYLDISTSLLPHDILRNYKIKIWQSRPYKSAVLAGTHMLMVLQLFSANMTFIIENLLYILIKYYQWHKTNATL